MTVAGKSNFTICQRNYYRCQVWLCYNVNEMTLADQVQFYYNEMTITVECTINIVSMKWL